METIIVNASKTYPVLIGHGVSALLPEKLQTQFSNSKVCFVSDNTVAALHLHPLEQACAAAGIKTEHFIFPHGEQSKNPTLLFDLLEFLAEAHFSRRDVLVALGGGVTGDLTGLAAALFMRGMHLIQMPTSLLSMVDSSVGGKTAVNLKAGKNLAGTFNQPDLVLCDLDALKTLPAADFADGMAEVIKYGVIADEALFDRVKSGEIDDILESVVARCISIKRDIVAEDEYDTGRRALLNFGHTLAHAIEAKSRFAVSHGSAVAMGMVLMARISEEFGYTNVPCAGKIVAALQNNHLPTESPYPAAELFAITAADKKCAGGTISIILPERIGRCFIETISTNRLKEMLHA